MRCFFPSFSYIQILKSWKFSKTKNNWVAKTVAFKKLEPKNAKIHFFCIALIQLPKFPEKVDRISHLVYPKKIWKREKKGKSETSVLRLFFGGPCLIFNTKQVAWHRSLFSLRHLAVCLFLNCLPYMPSSGEMTVQLGLKRGKHMAHRKASVCVGELRKIRISNPNKYFLVTWNSSIEMGALLRYLYEFYDSVLTRGKLWGGTTRSLPMHRCHNVPRVEVPSLLWDLNFKRWCWTTGKIQHIFGNWSWNSRKSLDFPLLWKIHFSVFLFRISSKIEGIKVATVTGKG